jgi:hypothetical protein
MKSRGARFFKHQSETASLVKSLISPLVIAGLHLFSSANVSNFEESYDDHAASSNDDGDAFSVPTYPTGSLLSDKARKLPIVLLNVREGVGFVTGRYVVLVPKSSSARVPLGSGERAPTESGVDDVVVMASGRVITSVSEEVFAEWNSLRSSKISSAGDVDVDGKISGCGAVDGGSGGDYSCRDRIKCQSTSMDSDEVPAMESVVDSDGSVEWGYLSSGEESFKVDDMDDGEISGPQSASDDWLVLLV